MIDRAPIDAAKRDRALLDQVLVEAGAIVNGKTAIRCPFHTDAAASGSIHQGDDGAWAYTCHAPSCEWGRTGDVFAVVRHARQCGFPEAVEHLGLNGQEPRQNGQKGPATAMKKTGPTSEALAAAEREAKAAAVRLIADSVALEHLWRTRGIDTETARRFGLGITGGTGSRFWTLPITDTAGRFVGLKAHRADGQAAKSRWQPKGVDRHRIWPADLSLEGPVWLCPGELKALAVIGAGRAALGITSGEGANLPGSAIELLRGRSVALVPDDDPAGEKWCNRIVEQLGNAGIDVRVVDLGLDTSVGLNDIGDRIMRELVENAREPEAVAATLDHRYDQADPWRPFTLAGIWESPTTWRPVTHIPTGLRRLDELTHGGLRTSAVHLLVGKPGRAKTQTAVQIAVNVATAGVPAAIVSLELSRHEVGRLVMAQVASVPRAWLDSGDLTERVAEKVSDVRQRLSDAPLTILDDDRWRGGLDRDKLAEIVTEGVARFGWRLVVVDYLGLLAPLDNDRSDFTTDLLTSTALRRIARKNDLALLVVAALRKSGNYKSAAGHSPILDDVAGAARLVYDATTVWLVDAKQAKCSIGEQPSGIVTLFPLKTRFSPGADDGSGLQFRWHPGFGSIVDLEGATPGELGW